MSGPLDVHENEVGIVCAAKMALLAVIASSPHRAAAINLILKFFIFNLLNITLEFHGGVNQLSVYYQGRGDICGSPPLLCRLTSSLLSLNTRCLLRRWTEAIL
jgi:hypothetical protein